ncbi:MAG TPA: NCS1 family nucleobase:cation symporter-1 [Phnomibacter sp.]|nr:NCS1 family nucleobase:cation symporter-1 [Phnomibacter sp.]
MEISEQPQPPSNDLTASPLYSSDLAPVPADQRTWNTWHMAAIWIGMAVCIPTYLLASYMIRSGLGWVEALMIIGISNLIITIPMVLNGRAGVKYGIPFPVIGRAAFGTRGVHIASVVRGIVACGWFGIQTWIGGLAIFAIFNVVSGNQPEPGLSAGQFISFGIFWFINIYFVWKGTERIKWLEQFSAPILIGMGLFLVLWGSTRAGGFGIVLKQSRHLERPSVMVDSSNGRYVMTIDPLKEKDGTTLKADGYRMALAGEAMPLEWKPLLKSERVEVGELSGTTVTVQFRKNADGIFHYSSLVKAVPVPSPSVTSEPRIWTYILWLTAMVGFWATMSISIADITRYASSQKAQVAGQFLGLPGTMVLYSFVGIFVTSAAVINFKDILVAEDVPWDPVQLIARFEDPVVVVVAQLFMLIATLSTNIAANVIAPANAFSNLYPKKISFRMGGVITGIIGIIICPWLLLNEISNILIFISGLLGPVLGILIADYFWLRRQTLHLEELYKVEGAYTYRNGFNPAAIISLLAGVSLALAG